MKIEKLRFDNLNSLGGHFELDLTHPALTDTGIFVITGPTGAGKTTLLDAITYALYGRTARQDKVTATSNEIMTHGARFCRAEVVVEKDGQRYLFSTEQKRRRARSENAPAYTTAERRAHRIGADGSASLLHSDVAGVRQLADSLMKYENFCRCMMLAQGDFALFLKSDAKTRSEALATITGTEIYQRIGEKVQSTVAGLKAAMEAVSLLPVLTAEARAAKEQQRDEQEARCRAWQAEREELNRALAWHEASAKAAATRQACERNREQAAAALHQFTEAGQPARIRAAEAAQGIRLHEAARRNSEQALADTRRRLADEQAWLTAHPDGERRAAAEQAAQALAAQQPALEEQLLFLTATVQPLEEAISRAAVRADEAARSTAARGKEAAEAAKAAQQQAEEAENAATRLAQAEQALALLAADAALVQELPAIRQRLSDWQKCPPMRQALPSSEDIAAQAEAEAAERAALLNGGTREELPLRLGKWEALARLHTRRAEAFARSQELACAKEAADKARAALPSVDEAEKAYENAQERAQLAYNIQSISGKLNELYREFCAGKLTHCPCCGSPTPHERPLPNADALAEAQQAAKAAQAELNARRQARDAAQEAYMNAKAHDKAFSQTLFKLCQEYQEALGEFGWQELPADFDHQKAQLRADIRRLSELDALAEECRERQRQDACRRALHEALRPCSSALPAQLAEAAELVKRLSDRQQAYSNALRQQETAARALGLARERAALADAQAARAAAGQEAAARAESEARRALEEQREALAALWQGGSARQAEKAARATLRTLQQQAQESREALQALTLERESHAARAADAEEQLPKLSRELAGKTTAFAEALKEHGFADEQAYCAARLSAETLEELRQQYSTLQQTLAAAQGAEQQAAEQENELRKQRVSKKSRAELSEQRDKLDEVLAEQAELLRTLYAELLKDDDARRDNADKEARLADTRRAWEQWQRLHEILGGTKDGFKKYAQRLTFNLLLVQANARLRLLTDRYSLMQDEREELGLRVLDRYRDDPKGRSCSNLSGGESFIVSLALALGLAQMAGETRIDTLFLDEGFGTLDEDALEQVLSCLQGLRASGKLIGIISHVETLRERIPANIELLPLGTTGLSTIAPHEAVLAAPGGMGAEA